MTLTREQLLKTLEDWNRAWDDHDLTGVMALFDDTVVFENWTGGTARGKAALESAWRPWFENHGGFRFVSEDVFVDETAQKVLFRWTLEWPSPEKGYQGQPERRRGVDVIHFKDGLIVEKLTYAKTTLEINGQRVPLTV